MNNNGTATFNVGQGVSLGKGSILNNGKSSKDGATFTVGSNFSIGDSSSGNSDSGIVRNYGMSTLIVNGNFSIYGAGGSTVTNGFSSTDAATLTIGGSFSMAANSYFSTDGTKAFSVADNVTQGADSNFDDFGIMSVGGAFDPGPGYPLNYSNSTVGGILDAGPGSTLTTDTGTLEVLQGGQLNIAAGAGFTIPSGGNLLAPNGFVGRCA